MMYKINPKSSQGFYWTNGLALVLAVILTTVLLAIQPPLAYSVELTAQARSPRQPVATANPSHNFIAAAVNQVGPAVVQINTERTIARTLPDPLGDPFFRRFFGDDGYGLPQPPQENQYQLRGQGSGFIIDRSGMVLTNAHVVSGADTVTVILKDGRAFEGEVRGADDVSDLAVVKIKGASGNLPVVKLGESEQVQVGDWAIAVGNPLGLDNTVTLGIVSTLHRSSAEVGIPGKRLDFIQTDAAINPGNSGGPLLNEQGEVIGINTAIRAGATGIGFAIPVDKAKALKDRLARGERISHPYLGVQMITLTPQIAQENNRAPNSPVTLPEINGVVVMQVLADTPAASAGLRPGDVIVEVEGQSVMNAGQLQDIVENSRVGQVLQIKVKRGNQTQKFAVRTAELQNAA